MSDSTPNHPPLWWIMQGAYFEGRKPGFCDRLGYAAELRAIADELPARLAFWGEGEASVQAFLRAEADKAEAGG